MIIKHQIPIKRLVLVAPPEGKHERLKEFFEHLGEDVSLIHKYVEEIIVVYSTDDKEGRVLASNELIEKTNSLSLKMNGFGHFNIDESKLIE
jgi:predicted alpha/beta hydrolase family esterase